jgi:hypothetical protein
MERPFVEGHGYHQGRPASSNDSEKPQDSFLVGRLRRAANWRQNSRAATAESARGHSTALPRRHSVWHTIGATNAILIAYARKQAEQVRQRIISGLSPEAPKGSRSVATCSTPTTTVTPRTGIKLALAPKNWSPEAQRRIAVTRFIGSANQRRARVRSVVSD